MKPNRPAIVNPEVKLIKGLTVTLNAAPLKARTPNAAPRFRTLGVAAAGVRSAPVSTDLGQVSAQEAARAIAPPPVATPPRGRGAAKGGVSCWHVVPGGGRVPSMK